MSAKPIQRRAAGDSSFDYIVVGSGPGGITVADKLSESGASVLLVERGPATTGQWGGRERPSWLEGTELSFYDVPALDNQIWTKGGDFTDGIFCDDIIGGISGCVLGGSSAINAGLWWKPSSWDWDSMFPEGWKSDDMVNATENVFSRLPGTEVPSQDDKLYYQQGANLIEGALDSANWTLVSANSVPDQKDKVYSNTTFMYQNGERSGPLNQYLSSAYSRPNFSLYTNAIVDRVVRQGSKVTGVDISNTSEDGFRGFVGANKGVVLAAGAFGTPKVLFRSGIGPRDQLEIVQQSSDSAKMISEDQWIDLPVGYNLMDNINTDIVISHPDVVYYDFPGLWDTPNQDDVNSYLDNRTGMLTQSSSNLNPMIWELLNGSTDGLQGLQWTARVDTSLDIPNDDKHNMVLAQYITIGQQARGRTTITPDLKMNVSTGVSIAESEADQRAIARGIDDMRAILSAVPDLEILSPAANISSLDYVKETTHLYVNHWLGSCKMGATNDGSAVVDNDAKVFGTDNLFVADGSVFPGQTTSNPCAAITIVGERVAQRILAMQ